MTTTHTRPPESDDDIADGPTLLYANGEPVKIDEFAMVWYRLTGQRLRVNHRHHHPDFESERH